MISRRSFIALASGLLVPEVEPVRAYSFIREWTPPAVALKYVQPGYVDILLRPRWLHQVTYRFAEVGP